ncbi:ATP-grasp domain-containing protein [Francisella tularensis]|uniref:ATP-grasp domain-containing protein n=1 Tax=Francisella tularensis TaxID=263 RepID=UPI00018553AE|nr:ATP-grasp domain-containing protein [Francisella tularensis]EDZ90851.1 conserved hypothetical protein [Francisella tularensis subsp. novicida FTG]MBK2335681.1 ATP-grasp domain-containing protein [Francisella tularensis subsp. novicida]
MAINVLVTGAGGGVGQGIIKSLQMISDMKITIIGADMSSLATGIYAVDKAYLVPSCFADGYLTRIERIIQSEDISFYFPGTDVELEFCAKNKEYLESKYNISVVVSSEYAIAISDNKYKTSEFLRSNNLYYPVTYMQNEIPDDLEFPVIVKPAVGCRSIGVSIANSREELFVRINNEKDLVVQELIGSDNDEYTCTIVKCGELLSDVLILKRVLRSGDTYRAEPVKSDIISNYVTRVASALKINGSCNFQLRLDANGKPKIFEINCRYSGTTPFCSQLGFNPVEFYLKAKLGIAYNYNIDFSSIVLRYWAEVLVSKEKILELNNSGEIIPESNKKHDLFKG